MPGTLSRRALPSVETTTGVDPPVAYRPTQIYNPAAVGTPHAVIFNNGASPAYIGSSVVTAATGMLFPPGAQLVLPFAPYSYYAVGGGFVTGTPSSTVTTSVAAGAGTIVVGSTTNLAAGTVLLIGAGACAEALTVSSIPGAGTVITTTASVFDHVAGATVATVISFNATSLSVNAGTT